jgi:hypothetical protein
MVTKENIEKFLALKKLAVIGVSRSGKKFGNTVLAELQKKGYVVAGVNPKAGEINGEPIYPNLAAIPEKPDGVVFVVPPPVTEKVLAEVNNLGIRHVWMQQGAESDAAIDYCRQHDINAVYKQCVMMHATPVESFHKFHRFINQLFGKLPK